MSSNKENKWKYFYAGLLFAAIMYVIRAILYPLIVVEQITIRNLLIEIPLCIICGVVFGLALKIFPPKEKNKNNTDII